MALPSPVQHSKTPSYTDYIRERSSAGEHCIDIAGVTGSIPVVPTIFLLCYQYDSIEGDDPIKPLKSIWHTHGTVLGEFLWLQFVNVAMSGMFRFAEKTIQV